MSVASVFAKPEFESALVTQCLFGEYIQVLKTKNKRWVKIKCAWDNAEGWIDTLQFYFSEAITKTETNKCDAFALELIHGLYSNNMTLPISIGANLPNCDGINLKLPFGKFQYTGQIINLEQTVNTQTLLSKIGAKYLHAPALKGGRSILGIDSSGLTQLAYKMIGESLPRTAFEQSELGTDIGFVAYSQVGDLAFFANNNNEIIHVGFIVAPMRIIHVHGKVKIDQLDNQGIYDLETKKYTYKLRTIRRIL